MLDDCKGPKFEELLAAFSFLVVRKVLAEDTTDCSITKQLILNDTALIYRQGLVSQLTLSYRVGLSRRLQEKSEREQRYRRLGRLLDMKKNDLAQRTQSLDTVSKVRNDKSIPRCTVEKLERYINSNWSGDMAWAKILVRSDRHETTNSLLERPFVEVWSHAANDTVHKIRPENKESLLQELERRLTAQNDRLQKWRNIQGTLATGSKPRVSEIASQVQDRAVATSVANTSTPRDALGRAAVVGRSTNMKPGTVQCLGIGLPDEYRMSSPARQFMDMKHESSGRYRSTRESPIKAVVITDLSEVEMYSSSESSANTPSSNAEDSLSFVNPFGNNKSFGKIQNKDLNVVHRLSHGVVNRNKSLEISGMTGAESITLDSEQVHNQDPKVDGNSRDVEALPSSLDKLSLVERTRMSMASTSPQKPTKLEEKYHTATLAPVANGPGGPGQTQFPDGPPFDTLLDRTRQSMSLMSLQSQTRRQSSKNRVSMAYPISQFNSPRRDQSPLRAAEHSILEEVLPDLDVDYETVFKSRPKIRLSPKIRPVSDFISGTEEPAHMEEPLNSEDDFA